MPCILLLPTVNSTTIISFSRAKKFISVSFDFSWSSLRVFSILNLKVWWRDDYVCSTSVQPQWLGKKEGLCISLHQSLPPGFSLSLRPLGIMALSCIIRLTPMVCQSVQEDHTHYPSCSTSPSTQKPRFHLVIWVSRAHQGRRQQRDMEVLPPLSADICVLYLHDYTGGFRVHAWQRRCSWEYIRHISSPGFCL